MKAKDFLQLLTDYPEYELVFPVYFDDEHINDSKIDLTINDKKKTITINL